MELYRIPQRSNQYRIARQRFYAALRLLQREKFPDEAFSDPRAMEFIARRLQEIELLEFDLPERERRRLNDLESEIEIEGEGEK